MAKAVVKRRINMQGGNAATAGLQATTSQASVQGLPVRRAFLDVAGIDVPPLGLGLAALGRPGYINLGHARDLSAGTDREAMRQQCWRVLDAAYAAGVR
ncbi:aldo_ket_red domain-containing protein [Haematococcus lacustris]|uniref:Aldo_ket_red domain-containing protein n=1 Tax=Haematococcus lacustris TaxID=44745 RepID=A0A699Z8L2_HAELA|nr:aldo_ket_red domain-containing protein [Haematococcus lacustris]